jgi:uridine kinase
MASPADALYRRTLRFVVSVAAELVAPKKALRGGHTIGAGYLYSFAGEDATVSAEDLMSIKGKIDELVAAGEKIVAVTKPWTEALAYFRERGLSCAQALLETRVSSEVPCYECKGVLRLALHPLADSTASLKTGGPGYELKLCEPGFVAMYSPGAEVQSALLGSVRGHVSFAAMPESMRSHYVGSVGALNQLQQVGRTRKDFVLSCEFKQEGELAAIARMVEDRKAERAVKIICIAGPTSSGKTTFANKLCMYLQNCGFVAKPLTVDHYYLPLDQQPKYQLRQQRSDVDYDHIESMDVKLVGEHLNALAQGDSVETPVYNMKTGYREPKGHLIDALPPNGILVIEGIHALNPLYTQAVDANKVFKVFISPRTALQMDDCNCVKTTDHRLLRRMCRDYLFRGNSASVTLRMWDNVRKGEGVWIFPHQNGADFVMNSAAEYEIPVLKVFLEPLLRAVTPEDANYAKAAELLKMLDYFGTWPPHLTPGAALLREFIGEGTFDCH